METFDHISTPLSCNKGINLVEASAGTGKTYAIANIFIRLLIEKKLNVHEILVVTYTNAAAGELRERIRARIKDALNAFSLGTSEDILLKHLANKTEDKKMAEKILTTALNDFDMASIFTIHSFCLRVLRQYAFESLSLFDTELAEEDADMIDEIIRDFWRINLFDESPLFLRYAGPMLKIDKLSILVRRSNANPHVVIKGDRSIYLEDEVKKSERECLETYRKTASLWMESKDYIIDYLKNDRSLNRTIYNAKKVNLVIDSVEGYFSSEYPTPIPDDLQYLCLDLPDKSAFKKNGNPPDHPFFRTCALLRQKAKSLEEIYKEKITGFKKMLIDYTRTELNKRKQDKNTRTFDDLLIDVYNAVSKDRGKRLAELINKEYKAILVDEFQDTDPVQYEIIKNVYKQGETIIFVIGDPKQSIYSFRGADIFSYLKASMDAQSKWTLDCNYRSSGRLIKAINTLFEDAKNPFVFHGLSFLPVKAGDPCRQEDLIIKGRVDTSPLKIWFLGGENNEKYKKDEVKDAIYNAIADEVVRLISMGDKGEVLIDGNPLSAKDIAILVRKNSEARQMLRALNKANLPGVIYSAENIFTAREAEDLLLIINAISEPSDESRLRAALITDTMGMKGDELAEITGDESLWNEYIEKFESYKDIWIKNGFIGMARAFLSKEKIKRRLLAMPEGERRVTNILHLIELLHKACIKHRLSMEGAIKWLDKKIKKEGMSQAEEYQMRLETDEEALKIVTIHRSKGLEYPVVFCPFNWDAAGSSQDDIIIFHDEKNNYSPTIDIRSLPDESSKKYKEIEELAESIRLLYVAITRAKKRCYIAWGNIKDSEGSGLAYVLHSPDALSDSFSAEELKNYIKGLSVNDIKSRLEELVKKSDGTIELITLPEYEGRQYVPQSITEDILSPRIFKATIDKTWRVVSFSSLVSKRPRFAELPDRDEEIKADSMTTSSIGSSITPLQTSNIFAFPQGAKAGLFIHDILEHMDFAFKDPEKIRLLIGERLLQYGFKYDWLDVIFNKMKDVVSAPLISNIDQFTLSTLNDNKRLHELEFYLPLNTIDNHGLGDIFDKYISFSDNISPRELIKELGFTPVGGMMRGFIDMVFEHNGRYYIVDWKSNFLGDSLEDYNKENIIKAMMDEYYFLQYHLYAVALNNLLSFRQKDYSYEEHFGGIFYIFIRGITPEKDTYGIFFDLPEKGLIEELNGYIKKASG